jgi:hypothetical protein
MLKNLFVRFREKQVKTSNNASVFKKSKKEGQNEV